MENVINGKVNNKKILNYLDIRINLMFREAQKYAEDNSLVDQVEKIDEGKFIEKDRREEFDLLNELNSYLSFESEDPANTYEFKGFEYPLSADGTNKKKTTIFVSKENALKISKKSDKFESVLGVKIPLELFLLKYQDTEMPGLDYPAPEPKTADITQDEHESNLETYYGEYGVERENDEVTGFRQAYPHEKINCRVEPPVMGNVGQEGYYSSTIEELNAAQWEMEHGDPGLEPGEESPVVKSEPLGRRFERLKNTLKEKGLKKKFLKGLCIVGIGAAAVGLFQANPVLGAAVLSGAGIGLFLGKFVSPKLARMARGIKQKIRDWWWGPEVSNDGPKKPTTPTMTTEELNDKIEELQMQSFVLEEEIRILNDEISSLPDENPAKKAKIEELKEKEARLHSIGAEVTSLLEKFDEEHSIGGPVR